MDNGALLNIKNKNGETPLHLAAANARDQGEDMLAGLVPFLFQRLVAHSPFALAKPVLKKKKNYM